MLQGATIDLWHRIVGRVWKERGKQGERERERERLIALSKMILHPEMATLGGSR